MYNPKLRFFPSGNVCLGNTSVLLTTKCYCLNKDRPTGITYFIISLFTYQSTRRNLPGDSESNASPIRSTHFSQHHFLLHNHMVLLFATWLFNYYVTYVNVFFTESTPVHRMTHIRIYVYGHYTHLE